jgi:HAE1 family hydrophobic/amphiphilic exporter-1
MGIGVQQLSNANALDVDRQAKAALQQLSKSFPPGLEYAIAFDSTTVVGDSIREVMVTLAEAIAIVIVVIFLFLLDWRATIIPAVTIPVSLIGTFAFIKIFGFSINSLTLFGITLATGLVVDDAIVVIENVQRHIAMEHSDPHEATSHAMGEVTSAVIATSLVLIAVFVPVSFFPGTTGILYRQFSLTIAFAIAISAFNALTLSPALSAMCCAAKKTAPSSWTFSTFARSRAPSPHSSTAPMRRSAGWDAPTARSSMSRCNCATCCCWFSSSGWAPRYGFTSAFPPASFRRKIRAICS